MKLILAKYYNVQHLLRTFRKVLIYTFQSINIYLLRLIFLAFKLLTEGADHPP